MEQLSELCIALPARVLRVAGLEADVDTGEGRKRTVVLAVPERIRKGDYVLLYGGTVINKIDRRSALEALQYMKQMAVGTAEEDGLDAEETERTFEERFRRLTGPIRP
jgi:hydrogenase assembly chaperone HypC/HupF